MTTSQNLTLLAIMVWPFVALVSCWSLYCTARLVMSVLSDEKRRTREHQTALALKVAERLDIALDDFYSSLMRHHEYLKHESSNAAKPTVPQTAERALVALIGSNGGIPVRRGEDTVRLLVHEVRKLYDELEHPTEPVRVDVNGSRDDDDLVGELFGAAFMDEDLDDDDDGDTSGATAVMDEEDMP